MSGIMYKNRPYAGGGGGAGGASALSDLTDTSISSPTNGQVLKYNNGFWENGNESGGTTVVANPQGAASTDLEKLQVGNNIYGIPQGTEVVANPTGTPTAELSTIQIGQDIYEIVGGGSGGGSFEKELLYSNNYDTVRPSSITLSKSYEDYDYLEFELWKWDDSNYYDIIGSYFAPKELLDSVKDGFKTGRRNVFIIYAWQSANQYIRFTIDSITQFTNVNSNGNFSISKIYGIKFGSGGGGITYGYTNPTGSASDGALYILLDNDDKERGKFLYMSNEWKLISGSAYVEAYVLYDNGTEDVAWSVVGGTKNADSIILNVGGGSFSNYAVTDDAIDLTDYGTMHIEYMFNNQRYEENVDISSYAGNKYISFTYLTDFSHNEAAIGLTDTKTGATTIRLKNSTSATVNQILYYMELR